MKFHTYKFSTLFTILLFIGAMATAQAQRDMVMVQVDGLGCPFCAYGLEKKFKELKGIDDVAIDIETGDFSFTYPAEKAITLETVTTQVEKAGYTPMAAQIERANGDVVSTDSDGELNENAILTEQTMWVSGVCGMCEARIEKAVKKMDGIAEAHWNKDTNMLTVSFDKATASINSISQAIAAVGHDTKMVKATDESYEALPGCCKYERLDQ